MTNRLRVAIVTGLMVCALLLSIAGAGAAKAETISGPVMTSRYWAQTCMRERLGYTGQPLAAWHRWCVRIQPGRWGHGSGAL